MRTAQQTWICISRQGRLARIIGNHSGIAGGADDELWKTRIAALLRRVARGEVALTGSLGRPDVGASSGNLLFSARFDDGSGEWQHDLVLRYQPADGLMNRYDMGAQFRVQHALADAGVKVARPLCLDDDGSLLGTPGYVMRRAVGVAPRQYYYAQGPMAEADVATRQALIVDMMETRSHTLTQTIVETSSQMAETLSLIHI